MHRRRDRLSAGAGADRRRRRRPGGQPIINYAELLCSSPAFFLALFAAAQAPELIVTDRQHGVLSLYLSRPMSGTDYALAKLARARRRRCSCITLGPQLVLFVGKVLPRATPWTAFKERVPQAGCRSSAGR